MRKPRLWWRILPALACVTTGAIAIVGWIAVESLYRFALERHRQGLVVQARRIVEEVSAITPAEPPQLQAVCETWNRHAELTVAIYDEQGSLVAKAGAASASANDAEVQSALKGDESSATRIDLRLNEPVECFALPLLLDGETRLVVQACSSRKELQAGLNREVGRVVVALAVLIAIAGALSYYATKSILRPIAQMRDAAERLGKGDLTALAPVPEAEELRTLAEAMNAMAHQLRERQGAAVRQGHEQQAVLASMVEGVLAVDLHERIISMNQAAANLLQIEGDRALGRPLQEIVRNTELRRFVSNTLTMASPTAESIQLHLDERVLQTHGAPLRDAQGKSVGAVVVLHDVTRLRRLENIRRDFVANVSHELKTPIASIKGFVETLLDGAIDNREDAIRFLKIVAKQSERLNAIIEDLLSLSKIEQEIDANEITLETGGIRDVIEAAVHDCHSQSEEKGIPVRFECDSRLASRINARLLEQAIANLLDNAIKYSEPGKEVLITAARTGGETVIEVRDHGSGIPADHLPRIFERFYRVDKARSRKAGGTGLGLAIVKHIVNAHGGRIQVESTPGKGSTFAIFLRNA